MNLLGFSKADTFCYPRETSVCTWVSVNRRCWPALPIQESVAPISTRNTQGFPPTIMVTWGSCSGLLCRWLNLVFLLGIPIVAMTKVLVSLGFSNGPCGWALGGIQRVCDEYWLLGKYLFMWPPCPQHTSAGPERSVLVLRAVVEMAWPGVDRVVAVPGRQGAGYGGVMTAAWVTVIASSFPFFSSMVRATSCAFQFLSFCSLVLFSVPCVCWHKTQYIPAFQTRAAFQIGAFSSTPATSSRLAWTALGRHLRIMAVRWCAVPMASQLPGSIFPAFVSRILWCIAVAPVWCLSGRWDLSQDTPLSLLPRRHFSLI